MVVGCLNSPKQRNCRILSRKMDCSSWKRKHKWEGKNWRDQKLRVIDGCTGKIISGRKLVKLEGKYNKSMNIGSVRICALDGSGEKVPVRPNCSKGFSKWFSSEDQSWPPLQQHATNYVVSVDQDNGKLMTTSGRLVTGKWIAMKWTENQLGCSHLEFNKQYKLKNWLYYRPSTDELTERIPDSIELV